MVECWTPIPITDPILIDSMMQASVKHRFGLSDTVGDLPDPKMIGYVKQNQESIKGYSECIVCKNNDKFEKRIGLNK